LEFILVQCEISHFSAKVNKWKNCCLYILVFTVVECGKDNNSLKTEQEKRFQNLFFSNVIMKLIIDCWFSVDILSLRLYIEYSHYYQFDYQI
jgi:hypothetical protein